ncbi:MAG: hypothetical protein N3A66_07800, partial [Planctomycetota bacterium]|nr:hypothetical protein [Planctomycetota bacterium]
MAAGTAQNASQEQPTAYPPPQPPHHSDRSPLPSAWGCAGCALVILVAIWLLRLFLGEHSSETLAAFAPSDALLYAEAGSPAACSQWLGRLGLISAKGDKTPLTIEDSIASWVASNLADVSSREARRVLEKIERAAIVWARGDGDRATWLLLLRLRGKIELPALVAAAPSTAGQARIALKDGTPIYTAQLETVAAFSPDAGLVRFSQESGQQPERTLANLAAQAVRPEKN